MAGDFVITDGEMSCVIRGRKILLKKWLLTGRWPLFDCASANCAVNLESQDLLTSRNNCICSEAFMAFDHTTNPILHHPNVVSTKIYIETI